MTLTIDLTPVAEARLRERAALKGVDPETLAMELLQRELVLPHDSREEKHLRIVDENGVFHEDRWQAVLEHLHSLTAGRPDLPSEALTREALYADHD